MSVMCGYAIVNAATAPPYTGADSCGNQFLLNDLVKGQYGFEGTYTPDAVTAERDTPQLNFANGGDGDDAALTLAQLQAIVGNGSADGQTNADGSQNLISQARLVDEVRRLVLAVGQERALPQAADDHRSRTPASPLRRPPRPRSPSRAPCCCATTDDALPLDRHDRSIAVIGTQAGPNADTSLGPVSTEQPQSANDGSAFVDPTNTFTDTATGQTFGYSSALSGIVAAGRRRDARSPTRRARWASRSSRC